MISMSLCCFRAIISGSQVRSTLLAECFSLFRSFLRAYFLQASCIVQAAICLFHSNSPASRRFKRTASLAFFNTPFVLNLNLKPENCREKKALLSWEYLEKNPFLMCHIGLNESQNGFYSAASLAL